MATITFKNSGLNQMLNKNRVLAYNDPAREFQIFLEDHRELLIRNSTKRWLTYDETELFMYRPIEFLLSLGLPISTVKIVLWLNQIKSTIDFKDIEYLLIPDHSIISGYLYPRYRSMSSSLKGNESKFYDK